MPFLMIRNDITKVAADAIVNPANLNLLQGSGTSRAHLSGGRGAGTDRRLRSYRPLRFGQSRVYSGIRAVGKVRFPCSLLGVAFPLLSSGNYGYPKEQAFRIAVDTITQYVMEHDLTVYLVLYDRDSLAVSRKLFASVEEYIDDHYVAQIDESYQFNRRRREYVERWEDAALADREYPAQECAPPVFAAAPPPPAAAPMAARSLESLMDNLGESFTTRLLRLIDERGLKDSTVYKQSNISRQHFSKIQCNRDYNPKKKTVLAFAVGLHLSEDETIDLLKSAGYAFSDGSKRDWIVRYCLEHKIYNINQVNTLLFEYDQEQLGA